MTNVGVDILESGHRNEPFKYNVKAQTWTTTSAYFGTYWAYNDRLDVTKTSNANPQRLNTNFEQPSFTIYTTGGALSERFSYFTELYLTENMGATKGREVGRTKVDPPIPR